MRWIERTMGNEWYVSCWMMDRRQGVS